MALPDSLDQLIALLGKFPGVGEKTARRMAFFVLGQDARWAGALAESIASLHERVHACRECGNVATEDFCRICTDSARDRRKICVVETQEDCVALEQSGVFSGLYHVLGGRCSPLEDQEIPQESIERLRRRIDALSAAEVILAMNPRIEGDMTAYALQEALADKEVRVTRLSYGLPVGGSIGYADKVTLHMAIESRREMEREEDRGA